MVNRKDGSPNDQYSSSNSSFSGFCLCLALRPAGRAFGSGLASVSGCPGGASGRRMELIIDLPVRFRGFEREDFIALFPRRLPARCYRPRVAAVNRVVIILLKTRVHCTLRSDRRACRWDRRSTSFHFQKTRLVPRRPLHRHRSVPGWDAREEIADCGLRIADLMFGGTCSTLAPAKVIESRA